MKTEIKIENISKSFDTQQVLDHITMDFQRGYIHLLSGKMVVEKYFIENHVWFDDSR